MNNTIVILDAKPAYLAGGPLSLLDLPFEQGTLLEAIRTPLRRAGDEVVVIRPFADGADSARFAERHSLDLSVEVPRAEDLIAMLACKEASDWLVFVDSAHVPVDVFDPRALLEQARAAREVIHLVASGPHTRDVRERVILDRGGRVQRIQRYYSEVTPVDACCVACSAMPVAVAQVTLEAPVKSLMDLRRALVGFGIPSQDVTAAGSLADLTRESGVLEFMERRLWAGEAKRPEAALRCGSGCRIHPTARLYGPVALHERVTLEADAIVIGPAIIGASSYIERGGAVTHCLLAAGTRVPRKSTVFQRVVTQADAGAMDGVGVGSAAVVPRARPGEGPRALGLAGVPAAAYERGWYRPVKRALDIVLAAAGLILLAPVLVGTALLIKLTSRGPVLFGHVREGWGGCEFRCWKFRTMVDNAHAQQRELYLQNQVDGPQFKLDCDPRITRLGHWLRTTNIDELPQLINVLLGHMSLIGPRPSPFRENQICVPWRQARLSVRPGISGLWQICRQQREAGDFHQWIHYDMLYVRHLSLWLDIKIVLFTLLTLAGRWSVPAHWLVPDRHRAARETEALPRRIPVLHRAGGTVRASTVGPPLG